MADKRMNPLLIGGVALALGCLSLVMCSERTVQYQPTDQLPTFDPNAKREDGDTQTDTIKALQAYARAAVEKADNLHTSTEEKMGQVLENRQKVSHLEQANQEAVAELETTQQTVADLEHNLMALQQELNTLRGRRVGDVTTLNQDGLPVGFGFDDQVVIDPNLGSWYSPIEQIESDEQAGSGSRFDGLLAQPGHTIDSKKTVTEKSSTSDVTVEPVYTLPKDATLTDSLALTALIGRIPVQGQTPDPYPVKIYIGKDNLLANGHDIPEVSGMIFSGLGFGDWNLSCVSARLMSATFIFEDGSIVNHSSQGQPLGYISDPSGVPCVAGRFVTNAPAFLTQRIGLASLGAAGAAYAEAQQERQTSSLTGTSTSTVTGNIHKLAAGEALQSATNEVSRWLLERQQQSFDAVVVNPGAVVSVHLDQSLPLDKHSLARKVRYASTDNIHFTDLD